MKLDYLNNHLYNILTMPFEYKCHIFLFVHSTQQTFFLILKNNNMHYRYSLYLNSKSLITYMHGL